ncbi:MAG: acyl-[acyl-carrier-protein] thioesterase [Lachnospiraceae bacterium]
MYSYKSRVRFSETNHKGKLFIESIVDYFQDCSTFQSEDVGVGISYLNTFSGAWILSSWQIIINRLPQLGEYIEVGTIPYDIKGFLGSRNYIMKDEDGQVLACANSLWVLMDMSKNIPIKASWEIISAYELEEKLQMEYAPRKIIVPNEGEIQEIIQVKSYHLDCNGHVNNGQYIRIGMEYMENTECIRQIRVEYKMQAKLNDYIVPVIYKDENKVVISLCNEEKKEYAIIEFLLVPTK